MNKRIRLLLIVDSFRIFALGLLGPIYAIFVEEIGGDVLDAGLAFALYSVVLGMFALIIGRLGDRIKNQTHLLFLGYSLSSIGFFGYLLVESQWQLMLTQIVLGVGGAFASVIFDGIFSASLNPGRYYSEWSMWEAENFIITGVAALAGSAIAAYLGFRILFFVMGMSSLFSLVYLYFLYRVVGTRS